MISKKARPILCAVALSIISIGPTLALFYSSLSLAELRNSVMRFVPAEAVSFAVVPDLRTFVGVALNQVLEIHQSIPGSNRVARDLVELLSPVDSVTFEKEEQPRQLPAPCPIIKTVADLERFGLDPSGSFAAMRLDTGSRAIMKFKDEKAGLLFLHDLLSPYFVRLSGTSDTDRLQIKNTSQGVVICDSVQRKEVRLNESFTTTEGADHIFSLGFIARDVPDGFGVECRVAGRQIPCKCSVFQSSIGTRASSQKSLDPCSRLDARGRRRSAEQLAVQLAKNEVVKIGQFYVGKLDEYYQIAESLGDIDQKKARLSAPTASVLQDDSYREHFGRALKEGKSHRLTVFGAVRPDWLISASALQLKALPLYLMTPFAAHFDEKGIRIEASSNLQPQDMNILKEFSADSLQNTLRLTSGATLGGASLSDRSIRNYAKFLRAYGDGAESGGRAFFPLLPVIVDILEAGPGLVTAEVVGWSGQKGSLIAAAHDVSAERADEVVRIARANIARRAALAVLKEIEAYRDRFKEEFEEEAPSHAELLCEHPTSWLEIDKRGKASININDQRLRDAITSRTPRGATARLLSDPSDRNTGVWLAFNANAYVIDSEIDSLLEQLREAKANLKDMRSRLPSLAATARQIEQSRSRARSQRLSGLLADASRLGDVLAIARLTAVEKILSDTKLKVPVLADVQAACKAFRPSVAGQSPVALLEKQTLFLADSESGMQQRPRHVYPENEGSMGKFRIDVNTVRIADALQRDKVADDEVKKLRRFPLPLTHLEFAGKGRGVDVSIKMRPSSAGK